MSSVVSAPTPTVATQRCHRGGSGLVLTDPYPPCASTNILDTDDLGLTIKLCMVTIYADFYVAEEQAWSIDGAKAFTSVENKGPGQA